tara:strand:- start:368 stop:748 length:381 start_codon:yes stop_codon:yes gene_type:complete
MNNPSIILDPWSLDVKLTMFFGREKIIDDEQKIKLRKTLSTYPGTNEQDVENQLNLLIERFHTKEQLINERGFSNSQAEVFLDAKGMLRPPGWHSVFFFPGSNRLRNKYIVYLLFIFTLLIFLKSY